MVRKGMRTNSEGAKEGRRYLLQAATIYMQGLDWRIAPRKLAFDSAFLQRSHRQSF
jgi:hypothetical protein